eukprot:95877_1
MNTFTTLFTVVFILNPLRKLIGTNVADSNLPWIFLKVPFLFILSDIIFHVTHYQLHRIHWLYEHVHKIHHQFVDTFALCATACHTLEHIIVNLSAVTLPTIILNIPFRWQQIYTIFGSINSTITHSGYYFLQHDLHH